MRTLYKIIIVLAILFVSFEIEIAIPEEEVSFML